jgi:pimeloyl-ACP methyl ester carboxylesterase
MQVAALRDLPLELLDVPTLIVHGTADRTVPFAHAERAARRIPSARLLPVTGADHALTLVAPQALGAIATAVALI